MKWIGLARHGFISSLMWDELCSIVAEPSPNRRTKGQRRQARSATKQKAERKAPQPSQELTRNQMWETTETNTQTTKKKSKSGIRSYLLTTIGAPECNKCHEVRWSNDVLIKCRVVWLYCHAVSSCAGHPGHPAVSGGPFAALVWTAALQQNDCERGL